MSSLAGVLLILGALMALVGGSLPLASPTAKHFFWAPLDKQLASIAGNLRLWQWLNILFIRGSLLTVFGALLLPILSQAAGDPVLSQLGLLSLLFSTAFWVVDLACRLSVTVWTAREVVENGIEVLAFFEPLGRWMGWLFLIYTMLTFVAIALYGGALLQTHLLAAWGAWIVLIYGIGGLVVFLITRDCPPAIHSIITFLIGLLLLFGVRS